MLGDAVEVAAVELVRDSLGAEVDRVGPRRRDRPVGRLVLVGRRRAGEAVGEDLVDDRTERPLRRRASVGDEAEVAGVGHVAHVDAGAVEPDVLRRTAGEQEAVGRDGVVAGQGRAPPGVARRRAHRAGDRERRLAVGRGAHVDRIDLGLERHPDEHVDPVAEARGLVGDVPPRPVVVRLAQPRLLAGRGRAHFTDPVVRPPTS